MKAALIYAVYLGCESITVRSDSQTLIRLLNSSESRIDVDVLVDDIRELVVSFDSIVFQFVPRTLNVAADNLTKNALLALKQFVLINGLCL